MAQKHHLSLFILAALMLLSACGGAGEGSAATVAPATTTAIDIKPPRALSR